MDKMYKAEPGPTHGIETCSPNTCEHRTDKPGLSHCGVKDCPNSTANCPKNQLSFTRIDPNSAYFKTGTDGLAR
jgi:hypothetical protein